VGSEYILKGDLIYVGPFIDWFSFLYTLYFVLIGQLFCRRGHILFALFVFTNNFLQKKEKHVLCDAGEFCCC
jgi:hypothetical protein